MTANDEKIGQISEKLSKSKKFMKKTPFLSNAEKSSPDQYNRQDWGRTEGCVRCKLKIGLLNGDYKVSIFYGKVLSVKKLEIYFAEPTFAISVLKVVCLWA